MAGSLTGYYGRVKSGVGTISTEDMGELGADYGIVAVAGVGIGLLSASVGGLDKEVAGITVPLDGIAALGLGLAGLKTTGDISRMFKVASIAAGGSAAVRTFEGFFKKGFGVRGDFTDLDHDRLPGYEGMYGPTTFAFGQGAQDRLVAAARYL